MPPTRPGAPAPALGAVIVALLALLASLAPASAARAATAAAEGGVLRVIAAPGERNALTIAPSSAAPGGPAPGDPAGDRAPGDAGSSASFTVADLGAPLVPGPGCAPADFGVTCVTGANPTVHVSAGDLDDSVTLSGLAAPARLEGGDGDDRLTGGDGPDVLLGGTGADFADGGAGPDAIELRDRFSDSAWCGRGRDSARAEVLDFLDRGCERVDLGRAGAVGRIGPRTGAGRWLPVPGQTWARVDRRILPGVLYMVRRYNIRITEGYAVQGHTLFGEHPLGLAVDVEPGPGGTWADVARLARWAEPRQNRPRPPFRWVGWNGDVNHGHPARCKRSRGCSPHLHLSWAHSPTRPRRPARTVWVFEVRP